MQLTRHKITGQYYALKALYIPTIVQKRQVDHVHNEKRVLNRLSHPFIVTLFDTAKDTRNLYMIMEVSPIFKLGLVVKNRKKNSIFEIPKFWSFRGGTMWFYHHSWRDQ